MADNSHKLRMVAAFIKKVMNRKNSHIEYSQAQVQTFLHLTLISLLEYEGHFSVDKVNKVRRILVIFQ